MVIKRFEGRGYAKEELFQIGVIGLIKAIDNFKTEYNNKFSTYAVPMIIGEIKRILRDDGMIHVSRKFKDDFNNINKYINEYEITHCNTPSINKIRDATGLSNEEIIISMDAGREIKSLSQPVGNSKEEEITLLERVKDNRNYEKDFIDKMTVKQLLNELNEEDRQIIILRYIEGKTQKEVANIRNTSQVTISRREKDILRKMRKNM